MLAVVVAFGLVAALAAVDVVGDLGEGTALAHALVEIGVVAVGLTGAAAAGRRLVRISRAARAQAASAQAQAASAQAQAAAAQAEATAARAEAESLTSQLASTQADAARWRAEARDLLRGLGAALDIQFERWALSPAEKEVALLLLKGLSHKEVADVRKVSEATARQQARAVYKKAGLSGRNDLAAFFLEDLLVPGGER